MEEDFSVKDNSGDKKYFTIIPNYVYNHSTHWDREVYAQMKRIAGENGVCWSSQRALAKQCVISVNRLRKSLDYLLKHSWIFQIGIKAVNTKSGIQTVNEYEIADLWKKNIDFYEKKKVGVSSRETPSRSRCVTADVQGVSPGDTEEYIYIKNINTAEQSSSFIPLLLKEFETINPAVKRMYGNTTQRNACAELIELYGFERLKKIIVETLPHTNGLAYFPTITTPTQLRDKFVSLESAIRKHQSETKTKQYQII